MDSCSSRVPSWAGENAVGAFGVHVINAMEQSPEAIKFFDHFMPGLTELFKPK